MEPCEPRDARPADVPRILDLICKLAEYERAAHEVLATQAQLERALFGDHPAAFCHVIDAPAPDEGLAGFAIWFVSYSTWLGVHGLYLEDLFVLPAYRGRGYGKAFMKNLARVCVERGYGRFEWAVLDWNRPAIEFYASLGARPQSEWTVHRLTGERLAALARE